MALTRRQKQVLDFIAGFIEQNGYSPSYEEIARGLELASLATVHKHISALETKHYVKRGFNQSRSLDLAPKYYAEVRKPRTEGTTLDMPLMGRIAAGAPVEAIAGGERLDFGDFLNREDVYALEVRGNSMIDDHICSGDLVLVENTQQVRDGEIVVALVRGSDATLKRLYREGPIAQLKPANAEMSPIRVPMEDLQIQGRVLAVLRKYR